MRSVRVALLWHMHQPSYRDPESGTLVMPWVRLHALKDYLGMVEVLSETPGVHATFNLVPSLLDQLEAYVKGDVAETVLKLTSKPAAELTALERALALRELFRGHANVIGRFPRLLELLERRGPGAAEANLQQAVARFTTQDFLDLQLLYELAWVDLDWQARDPVLRALAAKARGFDEHDKRRLAEQQRALLTTILPAYRRAAERGQVELTTSPYYHPILPLLCDTDVHREAHPGAPLPRRFRHPEDAADQIRRALARHESLFGRPAAGMWPSEGSVSEEAVLEMAKAGVRWTASDEGVLERSVGRPLHRDSRGTADPLDVLYRPWLRRTAAGDIAMLFRDRVISDLIGFTYSGMQPEKAAEDFLERLRRVGERWELEGLAGDPLVCVFLDGENAWEYFRDGGRVFLRAVYRGLDADPKLLAVTVSEALAASEGVELPKVFAGSWIHADFSVWIGHADDRRAWDLLGEAREALAASEGRAEPEALERAKEALRAACGSDWCWWYGEDHSSEQDLEFDRLFRAHLRTVYRALCLPVPEALEQTLITTRSFEARHTQPTGVVRPVLDGRITSTEEWDAAGMHRIPLANTAMHRSLPSLRAIRFGAGAERLQVMVETGGPARELLEAADLILSFPGETSLRYRVHAPAGQATVRRSERTGIGWVASSTGAEAAVDEVFEASIPLAELRPGPSRRLAFRVLVVSGGVELERHPGAGPIELALEEVKLE